MPRTPVPRGRRSLGAVRGQRLGDPFAGQRTVEVVPDVADPAGARGPWQDPRTRCSRVAVEQVDHRKGLGLETGYAGVRPVLGPDIRLRGMPLRHEGESTEASSDHAAPAHECWTSLSLRALTEPLGQNLDVRIDDLEVIDIPAADSPRFGLLVGNRNCGQQGPVEVAASRDRRAHPALYSARRPVTEGASAVIKLLVDGRHRPVVTARLHGTHTKDACDNVGKRTLDVHTRPPAERGSGTFLRPRPRR